MKQPLLRCVMAGIVSFLLLGAAGQDQPPAFNWPVPGGKIGKAGKDLQVLPYDDLFELVSYMQEMQKALGVTCVYCHNLEDFAIDDPAAKRNLHKNAARSMMRMVLNVSDYIQMDPFIYLAAGPSPFSGADLRKPANLAAQLRKPKDPLSQYLFERFSEDTRRLLGEYDGSSPVSESLREALIADLNRVVESAPLYDAQRFSKVKLTDRTRRLAEQNPQGEDLVRLNRLLLEEAYPQGIAAASSVSCYMCHRGDRFPSGGDQGPDQEGS